MLDRHIYVIGMPGSGKSSLSKKIASRLGLGYMDLDTRIQQVAGCTVSEFFERYGEERFRTAETNMLIQTTRMRPMLISTGGGAVMREINREIMRNHGVVLLIDRPLDHILGDIKLDRRPLLAQKGLGEVERLYHERINTYRATADLVLVNDLDYFESLRTMERLIRTKLNV